MINPNNLKKGGRAIGDLVQEFRRLFIMLVVFALVIGVLVYQAGSNGSINVSNATQTNIDALETAYDTQVTDNATSASGAVIGLVVLVVILLVFGGFIAGRGKRGVE